MVIVVISSSTRKIVSLLLIAIQWNFVSPYSTLQIQTQRIRPGKTRFGSATGTSSTASSNTHQQSHPLLRTETPHRPSPHCVFRRTTTITIMTSTVDGGSDTLETIDGSIGTESTVTNIDEDDDATTFIGTNGNVLHVTWESDVASDILRRAQEAQKQQEGEDDESQQSQLRIRKPYMVAIAGVPGSGKSSSAEIITHQINSSNNNNSKTPSDRNNVVCVCIPADGYHYSMASLQQMQEQSNDTTFIYRRGAPDTFDVSALLYDLEQIRNPTTTTTATNTTTTDSNNSHTVVTLPGFDHAMGDPLLNQHVYHRQQHSIVIFDGLYLLYNQHQWDRVQSYFDYSIYIQTASIDTCMDRVKARNVCIPGYTIEEIHERVDVVDRNNAILIDAVSPLRADRVVT